MFILFGWGFKTNKRLGSKTMTCPTCGNCTVEYIKSTSWFTLFFIPIFPYSWAHYELCPHCGNGRQISKDEVIESLNSPAQNEPASEPFEQSKAE